MKIQKVRKKLGDICFLFRLNKNFAALKIRISKNPLFVTKGNCSQKYRFLSEGSFGSAFNNQSLSSYQIWKLFYIPVDCVHCDIKIKH